MVAEGGVLGRVTERVTTRGVAILPSTIEHVVRRHPAVVDFRMHVYKRGGSYELAVQLEPDDAIASESDRARVAAEVCEDLRRSLGLLLQCDMVAPSRFADDQDAGRRARRLSRQNPGATADHRLRSARPASRRNSRGAPSWGCGRGVRGR